ncbi:ShlB/FhaC/HecB family hemolysin secretion/activation protein [Zavarzinia aquatilis]|uniref:ShlB/FhaC/HecB family hemolysin secretion/activation protein n=1 Tax=Zavarzinia aquatilis TaxID=2211142 RepID=A0A317EG16_9PROT|nr:POTRA domain-containing protein [Zavarzinia aquatilis]PWR24135.1 hypothetical protein DKG74_08400 [Zavarzinia aquatilis]
MTRIFKALSRPAAVALLAFAVMLPAAAGAQTLPSGAAPDRIEDRIRLPPVVTPPAEPIDIPEVTPQAAPTGAEAVTFTLKAVDLVGNSAIAGETLLPFFAPYLDQEVSLATLYEIAAAITAAYRDAGYVLSQAVVPAQRITDGRVRLQVFEGYVDKVTIQGEDPSGRIAAMAAEIAASRPLSSTVLERYLLLLQDIAGLSVRAILTASPDVPGAADLTLVPARDELQGYVSIDNRGTPSLGPYQATTALTMNDLFGWDGRATVTLFTAPIDDELLYFLGRVEQPLWHDGMVVSLAASYSRTRPGAALEPFDNEGEAKSFDFGLDQAIIRSRGLSLAAGIEFNWRDSTADFFARTSPVNLYDDHLRVLRANLDLNFVDGWSGTDDLSLTLSQGLGVAGASDRGDTNLSRANGDPRFTSLKGEFGRVQPLGAVFALSFRGAFQFAFDPLLASEEIGFGATSFGSAFESSSISGDSGLGLRLEAIWYWTLPPEDAGGLQVQGQSYGFADGGLIWQRDSGARERGHDSLSSVGLGSRLQLQPGLFGGWELAFPVVNPADTPKPDSGRLFFQLGASF